MIFEKSEVVKDDQTPYVVFTPYSKKWKENFKKTPLTHFESEKFLDKVVYHSYPFLSLNNIGFEQSKIKVAHFNTSDKLIKNYEYTLNFTALE